jgi:hypothetical protein
MGLARFVFLAVVLSAGCVAAPVTVPFVGCPSDGQQGVIAPPRGKPVAVNLAPGVAAQLAFYKSRYDDGVLAPRGWHCANIEGSDGFDVMVSPEPHRTSDFLGGKRWVLHGPAVLVTGNYAGTSGRFAVANLVSRYFPGHDAFVRARIAELPEFQKELRFGPYPADRLVARRGNLVEFITPPGATGLGTSWRIKPSDVPVHAVAALTGSPQEPDGFVFAVRLSKDQEALAAVILKWAERTYLTAK